MPSRLAEVIEPNNREQELLTRAVQAGVVVDYVKVRLLRAATPHDTHHAALSAAVLRVSERRDLGPDSLTPQRATGHRCTVDDFYGWTYDRARRRLLMIPSPRTLLAVQQTVTDRPGFGPYTWADQDDVDHLVWITDRNLVRNPGYAYAFTQPPYRLRLDHAEAQRLFREIDDDVLGGTDESTEIWMWSTDWADYFDDGHEWWGAFAWTLQRDESELWALLASTTD